MLYLFVLLAFAAMDSPASSPAPAQEMLWPLPVDPPAITGTFMEFRQGRFHSGMDLRTEGREGLPVRAPAAGSIVRLRTSPTGYGVAVYLKLDDGRMLVFGHLSVLSDRLRQPILQAWKKTGRYKQYLYLKPDELRVERGEFLALSGSTGVGAPHLHLEVRDANERPMNPQLHGFAAPDTVAPKITEIRVVPLGQGAHVEGERAARNFEPGASFSAAGTLGVMVRIDDRTGYSPFRVSPLGVSLEVDGEELYRLENEVFAFSQTGQMMLENFVDPENPRKSWRRLYRRPGNELPNRVEAGPPGATFVAREGEEHRLTIRAWDVNGGSGESGFQVRGEQAGSEEWLPAYSLEGSWSPYWLAQEGSWSPDWSEESRLLDSSIHVLRQPDPHSTFPCYGPRGQSCTLPCCWDWSDPGDGFHPGGVLRPFHPLSHPAPESAVDLIGVSLFRGEGVVFDRGMEVSVRIPDIEADHLGLFLADEQGDWAFLGPMDEDPDGGAAGTAILTRFGTLAVARDTTPPELGAFRVGKRVLNDGETLQPVVREQLQGVTYPDWPAVRIALKDLAAGIPTDGLETLLDGKPWPARWEPEDEVLVYEWWLDPGEGEHQLTVKARDGLGNASEASIRLSFQR